MLLALSTDQGLLAATAGLLAVTVGYVYFTRELVSESRATRQQAARPALALDLVTVAGMYVEIGIANVGQGAAIDVEVELAFVPDEGADREPVRLPFNWPMIRSGDRFQFAPPSTGEQNRPDLEKWTAMYPSVTLTGTVRDQLGGTHRVSLTMTELPTLRSRAIAATLAGLRETPERRDIGSIAKATRGIDSTLGRVAAALERPAGPE